MKVLLAVDETPASAGAAAAATKLFGGSEEVEFLVLSVAVEPRPWVMDPLGVAVPAAAGHLWRQLGQASERAAEHAVDEASERLPDAVGLVASGDPVVEICRAARENDVDVIVVGSHDTGLLRRLIDPPVSEGVLHTSEVPVLVVPSPPG